MVKFLGEIWRRESFCSVFGLKERLEKRSLRNKSADQILDTWENNGIDEAMAKFYIGKSPNVDKRIDLIALL